MTVIAHRRVRTSLVFALTAALAVLVPAYAHTGSMAFWKVTVDRQEATSQIIVSLADFGWTPDVLTTPEHGGAMTEQRRMAIGRELLRYFHVIENGRPVPATLVSARVLPPDAIEVVVRHSLSEAAGERFARSRFHELTDDSHRVLARVERAGATDAASPGAPVMLTATAADLALPTVDDAVSTGLAPVGSLRAMLLSGLEHIVTGYDHVLFLLCLLVPGGTWRSRVAIVTAFTAAHSVTLLLAALHVVSPPARVVEVAIALSLIYVALENLLVERPRARWPLAFGFGLVHGFGFAGMLDVLGMPTAQLVSSVLAFNVGIEIGQLAIVAVAVPVIGWMARHAWHHRIVQATSIAVWAVAAVWVMERLS